ncbi:Retinoic acid receptor responder protein 2 [Plecturocebus cupreus]
MDQRRGKSWSREQDCFLERQGTSLKLRAPGNTASRVGGSGENKDSRVTVKKGAFPVPSPLPGVLLAMSPGAGQGRRPLRWAGRARAPTSASQGQGNNRSLCGLRLPPGRVHGASDGACRWPSRNLQAPPVQPALRETSVDSAVDAPFPAGTFVRPEFKLWQTHKRQEEGLEETQVQSPAQWEEAELPDLRQTGL